MIRSIQFLFICQDRVWVDDLQTLIAAQVAGSFQLNLEKTTHKHGIYTAYFSLFAMDSITIFQVGMLVAQHTIAMDNTERETSKMSLLRRCN